MKILKLIGFAVLLILSAFALCDAVFYGFAVGVAIAILGLIMASAGLSRIA